MADQPSRRSVDRIEPNAVAARRTSRLVGDDLSRTNSGCANADDFRPRASSRSARPPYAAAQPLLLADTQGIERLDPSLCPAPGAPTTRGLRTRHPQVPDPQKRARPQQVEIARAAYGGGWTSAYRPSFHGWRLVTRASTTVLGVRVVIARCSVDYEGALQAHLPMATRLLMVKADGSVLVHSDGGSYKPLNWMAPPCRMTELEPEEAEADEGVTAVWLVQHGKREDTLRIRIYEVISDTAHELGIDPGLVKSGVEAQLQELLAQHIHTLGSGYRLLRREYPTAIGPVDILCKDDSGVTVAVEIKRRGDIDGVEQLTRYLELLNRDSHIAPVTGVFAAQVIKPQARTLATDRGIRCVTLDYEALRGIDDADVRLF